MQYYSHIDNQFGKSATSIMVQPQPYSLIDPQVFNELQAVIGAKLPVLLAEFFDEIDSRCWAIKNADNNIDAQREWHAIKGTAAAYGAAKLADFAARMEQECVSDKLNLAADDNNVAPFLDLSAQTKRAMDQLLGRDSVID